MLGFLKFLKKKFENFINHPLVKPVVKDALFRIRMLSRYIYIKIIRFIRRFFP